MPKMSLSFQLAADLFSFCRKAWNWKSHKKLTLIVYFAELEFCVTFGAKPLFFSWILPSR